MRRCLSIVLLCSLLICGCGSAEAVTFDGVGDSFSTLMVAAGYEVTNDKESVEGSFGLNRIEIAVYGSEHQVEMYYLNDSSIATKYYADFCTVYNRKTKTETSESVSENSYSSYRMEDNGTVYRIVRFDNKVLAATVSVEYEDELEKIIERLGEIYGEITN